MNVATGGEFVGVVAILVVFGMPIAYLIAHRYFSHQERMAMIQRGLTPQSGAGWQRRAARGGWCDPSSYEPPPGNDPYGYAEGQANRSLRKGITLAMIGFALLVGLGISLGPSGPWLLGGLIPLFVGIAQIIIAVMSGARFGSFGPPSSPNANIGQEPPPANSHYRPDPGPFTGEGNARPGSYAPWRPGPTTELEKPPSPPDVR